MISLRAAARLPLCFFSSLLASSAVAQCPSDDWAITKDTASDGFEVLPARSSARATTWCWPPSSSIRLLHQKIP